MYVYPYSLYTPYYTYTPYKPYITHMHIIYIPHIYLIPCIHHLWYIIRIIHIYTQYTSQSYNIYTNTSISNTHSSIYMHIQQLLYIYYRQYINQTTLHYHIYTILLHFIIIPSKYFYSLSLYCVSTLLLYDSSISNEYRYL